MPLKLTQELSLNKEEELLIESLQNSLTQRIKNDCLAFDYINIKFINDLDLAFIENNLISNYHNKSCSAICSQTEIQLGRISKLSTQSLTFFLFFKDYLSTHLAFILNISVSILIEVSISSSIEFSYPLDICVYLIIPLPSIAVNVRSTPRSTNLSYTQKADYILVSLS